MDDLEEMRDLLWIMAEVIKNDGLTCEQACTMEYDFKTQTWHHIEACVLDRIKAAAHWEPITAQTT